MHPQQTTETAAQQVTRSGKNTFLVVVVDILKVESASHLLTRIKIIRQRSINGKIGVFIHRGITSLNVI